MIRMCLDRVQLAATPLIVDAPEWHTRWVNSEHSLGWTGSAPAHDAVPWTREELPAPSDLGRRRHRQDALLKMGATVEPYDPYEYRSRVKATLTAYQAPNSAEAVYKRMRPAPPGPKKQQSYKEGTGLQQITHWQASAHRGVTSAGV